MISLVLITVSFRSRRRRARDRAQRQRDRVAPGQVADERVARPFRDAYRWFDGLLDATSNAARLEKENETLRQQVVESRLAERENARLRRLLHYLNGPRFPEGYSGLATAVISRPAGAFAQSIVVAAGRDDGVRVDDPVVTADGLVGRVSRTSSDRAGHPPDRRSERRVRARRRDRRLRHRAPGQRPSGAARLDRVPKEARVRYGDTIVTSGWSSRRLSSLYPRGIRIGRVTSVGRTDTDLYTQVQVTPFADLTALEAVLVLIPQDRGTS